MRNSESWWRSVDRPPYDQRHKLLIDVIKKWDKDVFGTLASYLDEHKRYPGWLRRGILEAYIAFKDEMARFNKVEYVNGADGQKIEREAMHGWYEKHYPWGMGFDRDRKPSGFAEFSRLLDEYPE